MDQSLQSPSEVWNCILHRALLILLWRTVLLSKPGESHSFRLLICSYLEEQMDELLQCLGKIFVTTRTNRFCTLGVISFNKTMVINETWVQCLFIIYSRSTIHEKENRVPKSPIVTVSSLNPCKCFRHSEWTSRVIGPINGQLMFMGNSVTVSGHMFHLATGLNLFFSISSINVSLGQQKNLMSRLWFLVFRVILPTDTGKSPVRAKYCF